MIQIAGRDLICATSPIRGRTGQIARVPFNIMIYCKSKNIFDVYISYFILFIFGSNISADSRCIRQWTDVSPSTKSE